MSFDSIVCVKQVPDTANVTGESMKDDGTVNRAALPTIFNPEDMNALEAALQVKDQHGGTVTVLTMGPPQACEVLRQCLYRGADRAILLTDRRAAASDTLATSYILSQAIRTISKYDLVFCGRQAIDGDTAQVGPQIAEKLNLPQVTYFENFVDLEAKQARLRRNVGNGWEVLESQLPVLITVLDTANEARPASAKRTMIYKRFRAPAEVARDVARALPDADNDAKEAEVQRRIEQLKMHNHLMEQWTLEDIDADMDYCGWAGSPTKVHRVQSIVLKKEGYTEIPATETGLKDMVRELIEDHTIG